MRTLVLFHRWLGVAFCLLFAMWFASGLVMHFVPYPALEETERVAGLASFSPADVTVTPNDALKALEGHPVRRLRLVAVGGTPVYVARRDEGTLYALEGRHGRPLVVNEAFALASARAHAQARGLDAARATIGARESHDQWTVANGFDVHRPLYRVTLNDAADSELYVSSVTGEVVLDSVRLERGWNWVGSVLHWIYPTILRKHWSAWDGTVWWLSLVAMIGAVTGTVLGVLRLKGMRSPSLSPFRGWMKWHHLLGLACALFVLTWIFSGWLSMDHGRLFSRGVICENERMRIEGGGLSAPDLPQPNAPARKQREVEWFLFAGEVIMRAIGESGAREVLAGGQRSPWLPAAHMAAAARALGAQCTQSLLRKDDAYPARTVAADAPAYRVICGETWFHIDGTDGRVIEKLDPSRRAYRWAFQALHTFDFPVMAVRPALRTLVIAVLCVAGFAFSVTGAVIGWRRLRHVAVTAAAGAR